MPGTSSIVRVGRSSTTGSASRCINRDELGDEAESTLAHLSEILGVPAQELGEQLGTKLYYSYQPVPVAEFVPEEVYFKIREEPERFPGVEVVEQSVRSYPQGRLGAHLVGWVGQINAEELERPRFSGTGPPISSARRASRPPTSPGCGEPGQERFLVNSDGEVLREFDPRPAEPGHDLRLALDLDVQRIAEEELQAGIERARSVYDESSNRGGGERRRGRARRGHRWDRGDGVVAHVPAGVVRARAHRGAAVPALRERAGADAEPRHADHVRAGFDVQAVRRPGGGEGGLRVAGRVLRLPGRIRPPGRRVGALFHNWDGTGAGVLSIADGLRLSCDTQYYAWGSQFYNRDLGTGQEELQRHVRRWGFGRPSGVDLPAEAAGTVPDRQYVSRHPDVYPDDWIPGVDILLAIGSGEMKATPLQVAQAYAAIASGKLCRPHLVAGSRTGRATP